jgi:hypothetical protein
MAIYPRKVATPDADEYERINAVERELLAFKPVIKHFLLDKKSRS